MKKNFDSKAIGAVRQKNLEVTDYDLTLWRTGLHAANPTQAQMLVEILDSKDKKIKELKELLRISEYPG